MRSARWTRQTVSLAALACAWALPAAAQRPPASGESLRGPDGGSQVPCALPLRWRVARVDPEFGLDERGVAERVREAARMWEGAVGAPLFEHDPSSGLPVRLVYDERQAAAAERARQERELGAAAERLAGERAAIERDARAWGQDAERQRAAVEDHRGRLEDHNARVRAVNDAGGADPQRLASLARAGAALREERVALDAAGDSLQARRRSLRARETRFAEAASAHDARVVALSAEVERRPIEAAEYREMVRREGDEIVSVSREIRVYRYDDARQLVLALAHELGHALGLGHASDPGSVMSAARGPGDVADGWASVTPRDARALRSLCAS